MTVATSKEKVEGFKIKNESRIKIKLIFYSFLKTSVQQLNKHFILKDQRSTLYGIYGQQILKSICTSLLINILKKLWTQQSKLPENCICFF